MIIRRLTVFNIDYISPLIFNIVFRNVALVCDKKTSETYTIHLKSIYEVKLFFLNTVTFGRSRTDYTVDGDNNGRLRNRSLLNYPSYARFHCVRHTTDYHNDFYFEKRNPCPEILLHTLCHYQPGHTTPDCTRIPLKTARSIVVTSSEFWGTFDLPRIFVKSTHAHG